MGSDAISRACLAAVTIMLAMPIAAAFPAFAQTSQSEDPSVDVDLEALDALPRGSAAPEQPAVDSRPASRPAQAAPFRPPFPERKPARPSETVIAAGTGPADEPMDAPGAEPVGVSTNQPVVPPAPALSPALNTAPQAALTEPTPSAAAQPQPAPDVPQLGEPPPPGTPEVLAANPPRVSADPPVPTPQRPQERGPDDPEPPPPLEGAETAIILPDDLGFRLLFAEGSDQLSQAGVELLSRLAADMQDNESLRVQVRAFAGGTSELASDARRLSLNRALVVRTYLIDQGVRGTRIDVRALGNTAPDQPRDRVDLLVSG